MWINFHNQQRKLNENIRSEPDLAKRPFQFWWWVWLAMTGLALGLTVSCKWVGLFTIATIGVSTVKSLWEIWGDIRVPVVSCMMRQGTLLMMNWISHRLLVISQHEQYA